MMKWAVMVSLAILALSVPSASAGTVTRSFNPDPVNTGADVAVSLLVTPQNQPGNREEFYAIDEVVPSQFIVKSFWTNIDYNLAANCGQKDSTVTGVTCEINACDIYNNRWCNNFAWTSTGYDTHCGSIDSEYTSVTCVDGACDIYRDQWCNGGTWTTTNYASRCGIFDSANCNIVNQICSTTCSAGACDLQNKRFCFAVTDGGKTSEIGHVKWVVTSGATQTTYDYDARAPSSAQTVSWTGGDFQFNGSSTSSSIGGDISIVVQAGCVPTTEVCDGVDNDCDGVLDGSEGIINYPCGPLNETGICRFGSQSCTDSGGWTTCANGVVYPAAEACPWTSADEDCDGDTLEHRGNVNCNCGPGSEVDIADLSAVATQFGTPGTTGDLNGDSVVDIFDLVIVGSTFGNNYC